MSKHRVTKKSRELAELAPMMEGAAIFRRSRRRSVNTPEVSLAHEALTSWLNGENSGDYIEAQYRNSPESTQRLLELLKLVQSATAATESAAARTPPYAFAFRAAPPPETEFKARRKATVEPGPISRALTDYATTPYLVFEPSTKLWGIGQWPVAPTGHVHNGLLHMLQPTARPYGEVMAAHGILELVRSNALSRIRQCDCGRWYFAKREDGVACSDVCRKRIHDRKPEVIEKRRLRAKEQYQGHKAGKFKEVTRGSSMKESKMKPVKRNG